MQSLKPDKNKRDRENLGYDTVTLENILNEPHSPNPHLEQSQLELARVLSDIDQFDPDFQAPHIENPNFQTTHPENPNATASQPENPYIDSDTTTLIPGIKKPLMIRQLLSIQDILEIPSPYHSTPPNTPPSPIIISDSPTPSPINHLEDHLRTVMDLEALDHLASTFHKIVIPKPKPTITKEDVGRNLLIFETELMEWVNSLKQASLENPNPTASDSQWNRL